MNLLSDSRQDRRRSKAGIARLLLPDKLAGRPGKCMPGGAFKMLDPHAWTLVFLEILLAWLLLTEGVPSSYPSLTDDAQARSMCNLNSDNNPARDIYG